MTDVEHPKSMKQKKDTDVSLKSPRIEGFTEAQAFAQSTAFGAKIQTPSEKAQPARPRFASGYSGKNSARKGKLNDIDDESMLEFEKLEVQIGQSEEDRQSCKSGKSRTSSYRKPGINTSRQSNKSRQSMEEQDLASPMLPIANKKAKVQHGCCYNVFCCGGCTTKGEEDNEVSLAKPEKMTPQKKKSQTSTTKKKKDKKSFITTEGIEEQSNEDDESQRSKKYQTLQLEQDEITQALERVQITSQKNETEQSAQEILSSGKGEDKSPPISENQQISQKSEADDDVPAMEEEEDQEMVTKEDQPKQETDGNDTEEDGNQFVLNEEDERKKLAAKKMYVIQEVDEDDYLSDPNASRLYGKRKGSEADHTKVDIIMEEKNEDDENRVSPNRKRAKSSQAHDTEEIDRKETKIAQSVSGKEGREWIDELVQDQVALLNKSEPTISKQATRKISESIYCDADKPMTQEQVIAKIESKLQQERKAIFSKIPQIDGQYYKDFDQFVETADLQVLDQEDGQSIMSNMEKEMLKSSTSSQKLLNKQTALRQSQELAAKKALDRNLTSAEQKRKEALLAKQKAMKLQELREKRSGSAIKIQKVWKGYRQRVFFEELFVNFKSVKKTRKVFDKTIEDSTVSFKNQVVFVLKSIKEAIEREEAELFSKYQNHCASQIQAYWKGATWRQQFPAFKKAVLVNRKIKAFVRGWRLRKTMQNQHIFMMRCMIRDLTQVQNHFVYVEKCDNMPLLEQLKKDRRKAVEEFAAAIKQMARTGEWTDGYLGKKTGEEPESEASHTTNAESGIKERKNSDDKTLRELVSTDRLLYDADMERLDKFIDFDTVSEKNRKRDAILAGKPYSYGRELNQNLDNLEDEELMALFKKKGLLPDGELLQIKQMGHSRQSSHKKPVDSKRTTEVKKQEYVFSETEREKRLLKDNPVSFDQMLENALKEEAGPKKSPSKVRPGSQNFLKKKDRYDPLKTAKTSTFIDDKRVNQKRVFQKQFSEQKSEISDQDVEPLNKSQLSVRWNKSFVQNEIKPNKTKKTPEFPSLGAKLQYYTTTQPAHPRQPKRRDSELQALQLKENLQTPKHGKTINSQEDLEANQSQNLPSQRNSLLEESVAMNINELESQFMTEFNKVEEDFFASSRVLRKKDSQLPLLRAHSVFFGTFDEKVMESVQGDLMAEKLKLLEGSNLPRYKPKRQRQASARSKGRRTKNYATMH